MMEEKIDRYGKCPNCGTNWDGGDVLESLSKMDIHREKSTDELIRLAAQFGWTPNNKTNFSNLRMHEINDEHLLECPKIGCGRIYNRYTGEEYRSLFDARNGNPIQGKLILDKLELSKENLETEAGILEAFAKMPIRIHATAENRAEIDKKLSEKKLDDDAPF